MFLIKRVSRSILCKRLQDDILNFCIFNPFRLSKAVLNLYFKYYPYNSINFRFHKRFKIFYKRNITLSHRRRPLRYFMKIRVFKQKLRLFFGFSTNKQLAYLFNGLHTCAITTVFLFQALLNSLEFRLDFFIYRLRYVFSLYEARLFINQWGLSINNRVTTNYLQLIKLGDYVTPSIESRPFIYLKFYRFWFNEFVYSNKYSSLRYFFKIRLLRLFYKSRRSILQLKNLLTPLNKFKRYDVRPSLTVNLFQDWEFRIAAFKRILTKPSWIFMFINNYLLFQFLFIKSFFFYPNSLKNVSQLVSQLYWNYRRQLFWASSNVKLFSFSETFRFESFRFFKHLFFQNLLIFFDSFRFRFRFRNKQFARRHLLNNLFLNRSARSLTILNYKILSRNVILHDFLNKFFNPNKSALRLTRFAKVPEIQRYLRYIPKFLRFNWFFRSSKRWRYTLKRPKYFFRSRLSKVFKFIKEYKFNLFSWGRFFFKTVLKQRKFSFLKNRSFFFSFGGPRKSHRRDRSALVVYRPRPFFNFVPEWIRFKRLGSRLSIYTRRDFKISDYLLHIAQKSKVILFRNIFKLFHGSKLKRRLRSYIKTNNPFTFLLRRSDIVLWRCFGVKRTRLFSTLLSIRSKQVRKLPKLYDVLLYNEELKRMNKRRRRFSRFKRWRKGPYVHLRFQAKIKSKKRRKLTNRFRSEFCSRGSLRNRVYNRKMKPRLKQLRVFCNKVQFKCKFKNKKALL